MSPLQFSEPAIDMETLEELLGRLCTEFAVPFRLCVAVRDSVLYPPPGGLARASLQTLTAAGLLSAEVSTAPVANTRVHIRREPNIKTKCPDRRGDNNPSKRMRMCVECGQEKGITGFAKGSDVCSKCAGTLKGGPEKPLRW